MEITNRVFTKELLNPASEEYQTLYKEVSDLLQNIYGCPDINKCPTNSFYGAPRFAFYLPMEITNKVFTSQLLNPASEEYQTMYKEVSDLLQNIYGCPDVNKCPTNSFYGGVSAMTFSTICYHRKPYDHNYDKTYNYNNNYTYNDTYNYHNTIHNYNNNCYNNTNNHNNIHNYHNNYKNYNNTYNYYNNTHNNHNNKYNNTYNYHNNTHNNNYNNYNNTPNYHYYNHNYNNTHNYHSNTNNYHNNYNNTYNYHNTYNAHNYHSNTNNYHNNYNSTYNYHNNYHNTYNYHNTHNYHSNTYNYHNTHDYKNTYYHKNNTHNYNYNTDNYLNHHIQSYYKDTERPSDPPTSGGSSSNNGSSDEVPGWAIALLVLAAAIFLLLVIIFIMMLVRLCCKKTESGYMDTAQDPYYNEKTQPPHAPALPMYSPPNPAKPEPMSTPVIFCLHPPKSPAAEQTSSLQSAFYLPMEITNRKFTNELLNSACEEYQIFYKEVSDLLVRWCCKKTDSGFMDTAQDPYYNEKTQPPHAPALPVYSPPTPAKPEPMSTPVMVGDTPKNRAGFYAVNP
ncbi:hypothetical protein D9C73_022786 [Collichthys lucidus]|uniref:Mucin-1 n=1 Tax=Collichthys lucidus TaxID=240159 RepID=A0A4U5VK67_COLLU|nr:hypothetical protein D9C73_022786 [Collichthys lucidus]